MNKPARWIALLGVDGTGKSTVLRELKSCINSLPYEGIHVFHRRPGLAYRSHNSPTATIRHYEKPAYGIWISIVKLFAMVLDWEFGYWSIIRKNYSDGYLVIADRHSLFDLIADPLRYRYGGPKWLVRLALRLVPKPDLVLLLDAPLEVLLARKSELPAEKMAELRHNYLQLCSQIPNCSMIDASQPLAEVVSSVKEKLRSRGHPQNGKVSANLIGIAEKVKHEK
jgi:thymidylate kinase